MQTHPLSRFWFGVPKVINPVVSELQWSWRCIFRDLSASVIPAMLFLLAAWRHSAPTSPVMPHILHGLLYFALYIYPFCLANQIVGVEEDRLNKPDRPLVTGALSMQGAYIRWVASMVLLTLVGWWLGVLVWALLWQAVIVLYNFGGWSKRWYSKDLCMGLGTLAQITAAWQMVTPITPTAWQWIWFATITNYLLVSLQDLRDLDGDRATGRVTLPIAFGADRTRIMLAIGFLALPMMLYLVLLRPLGWTLPVLVTLGSQALLCFVIAGRTVWLRTASADHRTYMLFTYWYCIFLASAIITMA